MSFFPTEDSEEDSPVSYDDVSDSQNPFIPPDTTASPFDLSNIYPDCLAPYEDDRLDQSTILARIVDTPDHTQSSLERFDKTKLTTLDLSKLKKYYEDKDERAVNLLTTRHVVDIDKDYRIPFGSNRIFMDTDETMIDYHLTVANCLGFSSLLPNARSDHRFSFDLDLQRQYIPFKGKHAMLGFDPAGSMLSIGRCNNEEVFLAMAPNEFLRGRAPPPPPGHASASPTMSTRHYRQMVMLFAHFLALIGNRAFYNLTDVYKQNLDSRFPKFGDVTNIMSERSIKLNFEQLKELDEMIVEGYDGWVKKAPEHWKVDGFLLERSPIIVTSRYGQDSRIAVPGEEEEEARAWDAERDFSKLAYFTFAIATSVKCFEVKNWEDVPTETILEENPDGLFDGTDPERRRPILDLKEYPMLEDDGQEKPIYDLDGRRVGRRNFILDDRTKECGVLLNLENVQSLFDPYSNARRRWDGDEEVLSIGSSDTLDVHQPRIDVYPLAFLRTLGNVQADGVPSCLYPTIAEINRSVGNERLRRRGPASSDSDRDHVPIDDEDEDEEEEEDEDDDPDVEARRARNGPSLRALKPVSSQIYSYLSHRVANRAGGHDSQQGTVTAAIAGGYALTDKDKRTARMKQMYCKLYLPSDRFRSKISSPETPICCRAEFVYSVDIRALDDPSGRSIFENIILPLVRSWDSDEMLEAMPRHLVVLKPKIFPELYNWVSYPITLLIRSIYRLEIDRIESGSQPCPFRLELLASLERTLCFCHTGNAAVLATSLMNPLALGRSLVKDGFPMLDYKVFETQSSIHAAMTGGLTMRLPNWPTKGGHPAVASRRAQVLTYSLEHFMTYQARLRIDHALKVLSPVMMYTYPKVTCDTTTKGLNICRITFEALFDDVKHLVARGVHQDIARRKSTAKNRRELARASERGVLRESNLNRWLKFKHPLAYGEKAEEDVFESLVLAVRHEDDAVAHGLPNWNEFATSRSDLATSLYEMSKPVNPAPPKAPILRRRSFLPVLKVAHLALISLFKPTNKTQQKYLITKVFQLALVHFKVNFFPAPKLSETPRKGAPHTKPVFDSWGNLGHKDRSFPAACDPSKAPIRRKVNPARIAFNNARANDCNAPWKATGLTLKTLRSVLNRTDLPEDFREVAPSNVEHVDATYLWVRENYDGTKPLHHLALLVSIVIASTLVPHLFTRGEDKPRFTADLKRDDVRAVYEGMDWIVKEDRRGMKERSIFVTMFTTYIIAMYEENSPLRKHLRGASRRGIGDQWRNKHAVKGVTYTTLIRVGMAWGKGPKAYEKGLFGRDWGTLDMSEIELLYRTIVKRFGHEIHGPFDVLATLIGDRNARKFSVMPGVQLTMRPPIVSSTQSNLENMYIIDLVS